MMLGDFFWLLFFSGFFLYWAFDAFVLQLSSRVVVKAKPSYWTAVGITGLVYVIEVVIGILAMFLAMAFMGRVAMMDMMHSDFSSWFSFVPWVVVYITISVVLFALLIGWLYGRMLRDTEGRDIRFGKGILVFLLQFVITRAVLTLLVLIRFFWVGSWGLF